MKKIPAGEKAKRAQARAEAADITSAAIHKCLKRKEKEKPTRPMNSEICEDSDRICKHDIYHRFFSLDGIDEMWYPPIWFKAKEKIIAIGQEVYKNTKDPNGATGHLVGTARYNYIQRTK